MKNKKKENIRNAALALTGIVALLLLVILIVSVLEKKEKNEKKENPAGQESESVASADTASAGTADRSTADWGNKVYYNGQTYAYNYDLLNILFLGVDKKDALVEHSNPGTAGQTDSIMLISLNTVSKEVNILQISRDTMTAVEKYDSLGQPMGKETEQIALQFAYGNGKEFSGIITRDTVSNLLFGAPIDNYLAIDIAGIKALNNAIGGVEITIPEDYTAIDPAFEKGKTLKLSGEQAEKYVRYRDTSVTGSNNGRMERQAQFIPALIDGLRKNMGNNTDFYEHFFPVVKDYMVTDLSAQRINSLGEYELDTNNIYVVPGEVVAGAEHDEFYVNDDELQEILIKMLYKSV